jgi:hypothetical protein
MPMRPSAILHNMNVVPGRQFGVMLSHVRAEPLSTRGAHLTVSKRTSLGEPVWPPLAVKTGLDHNSHEFSR